MTNLRNLAVVAAALSALCLWGSRAVAQTVGTGVATFYDVTLEKVELCTGNGGGNGCDNPFVLGSGVKTFDIASAAAGGDVGSYASVSTLPVGTVYRYVRATISRTFKISGSVSNVGGSGINCRTGGSGTGATGFTLATAATGDNTAGTASSESVVAANGGAYGGGSPNYTSNLGVVDNSPTMTDTIALTSPFTVTSTPPTVRVTFDTQNALGALINGGNCVMWPAAPSIHITVQ